jgi:hypothetical protein
MAIRLNKSQAAKPKEADVQRLIIDWLAAKRIWHMRLNTGAMTGVHKGKKWFVRFGKPGMADILVVTRVNQIAQVGMETFICAKTPVYWIEVKGPDGKQTDDQVRFEFEVGKAGMGYILARSLEDVQKVIE